MSAPKPESNTSWVKRRWNALDDNYIKPYVIHNFPNSVSEHDELATKIRTVYKNYHKNKKHNKQARGNVDEIELEHIVTKDNVNEKEN